MFPALEAELTAIRAKSDAEPVLALIRDCRVLAMRAGERVGLLHAADLSAAVDIWLAGQREKAARAGEQPGGVVAPATCNPPRTFGYWWTGRHAGKRSTRPVMGFVEPGSRRPPEALFWALDGTTWVRFEEAK